MPEFLRNKIYRKEIQRLLGSSPDNPRAHFLIGLWLAKRGYLDAALEGFRMASSLTPASRQNFWGNAGRLACQMDRYDLADEALEQASYLFSLAPEVWQDWQSCLRKQGRGVKAFFVGMEGFLIRAYLRFR
jgi:tetratricopeptide (TPR) repeat protein